MRKKGGKLMMATLAVLKRQNQVILKIEGKNGAAGARLRGGNLDSPTQRAS